jgi:hypothetical protein
VLGGRRRLEPGDEVDRDLDTAHARRALVARQAAVLTEQVDKPAGALKAEVLPDR